MGKGQQSAWMRLKKLEKLEKGIRKKKNIKKPFLSHRPDLPLLFLFSSSSSGIQTFEYIYYPLSLFFLSLFAISRHTHT